MSQLGQLISASASGVTSLTGDSGLALTGALKIKGGSNITTAALGTDITVNVSGTTNHAIQLGNVGGSLSSLGVGATGTVLTGVTGADPAFSATPTVTTIYATTFDTNVAAAGVTLSGTTLSADGTDLNIDINITAKGTGQVIIDDLQLGTPLTVQYGGTGAATLTDHAPLLGSGTAAITPMAAGLNGETIMGTTGADCSWTSSPQFGGSVTATNDINTTAGNLTASNGGVIVSNNAVSTADAQVEYRKTRTSGIITSGDGLGTMRFEGYDGVSFISGSKITSTNSGTVAVNRIAGDLKFYTHPDSIIALPSEPLLRMTINPNGSLVLSDAYSTAGTPSGTAKVNLIDSNGLVYSLAGTSGQVLQGGTAPSFSTTVYPSTTALGDVLIATAANTISAVTGATTAGWVLTANGALASPTFQALPGGTGVAFTCDGGTTSSGVAQNLLGTANQITTTGNGTTTMTLSIPSSPSFDGTTTVATGLTVTTGDITLSNGDAIIRNYDVATTSPIVYFKKDRSNGGALTALSSGDLVGTIKFSGYDGTQYTDGARITSTSSGTIANTRVASDLKFYTHPDSASADPTLRMTVASTGAVTIASPDSGVGLTITAGGETITAGNLTLTAGTLLFNASNSSTQFINYPNIGTTASPIIKLANNPFLSIGTNQYTSLYLGYNTPAYSVSGSNNTILGNTCAKSLTSSSDNTIIGYYNLYGGLSSQVGGNTIVGAGCAYYLTSANNTIIGRSAVYNASAPGNANCVIGAFNMYNGGGAYNTVIGLGEYINPNYHGSGWSYTGSEASNILINSIGVLGESNCMHLGTSGTGAAQVNNTWIAGTYAPGTALGATQKVLLVDSTDKIGGVSALPPSLGGKMTWTTATGDVNPAAVNTGYLIKHATPANKVTITLPTTSALYDEIEINGVTVGMWRLAQNANQTIHFASINTTTGAGGYIEATSQYDCIKIRCVVANLDFVVVSSVGTLTIV